MEEINKLLTEFNHFKDAQIRSIQAPSNTNIILTLAVQDDDGVDTHLVQIEFNYVKDARLLENAVLSFLDMMSGVSIVREHEQYGFAIGNCDAMLCVLNAPLFIIASEIKVVEKAV